MRALTHCSGPGGAADAAGPAPRRRRSSTSWRRRSGSVLVCGHYEGVDERVREHLVDDEISIGDYVLSGGECAAMVVIDAVVRRLPGTLGSEDSLLEESHSDGLLEYPQYTRPAEFRGWQVPDILLSGNHGEIARWRRSSAIIRTAQRRPDLLEKATLSEDERQLAADDASRRRRRRES